MCAGLKAPAPVTWRQISSAAAPPPFDRIAYGTHPLAFGELRLPKGPGPHPVALIVHGGCWQSEYDLRHLAPMSAALAEAGLATWTLEFRRIGDVGGGWPGTFEDVARGADHLRTLAREFPLDLRRVVAVGHSAGGHLALWLAARRNLPERSALRWGEPLPLKGVVSLAGICDLRSYGASPGSCNDSVERLLEGAPAKVPERYAQANPSELLPLRVPVRLVQGALDTIVRPEQSQRFAAKARAHGDDARVVMIDAAGHFDVIAPFAPAFEKVRRAVVELARD